MDTNSKDDGPGRIPKNRARVLIIGTFVLMIIIVFTFMILVGTNM
ncbi:hypothetical protein [Modestobacter muralis]|nr:hypothetical protein [Modestobacter muralis]